MSIEENKALVRRYFEEVISNGNMAAVTELLALDFVLHFSGVPDPVRGPEAFTQFLTPFRAAFPDMQDTLEEMIAEGDQVAVRGTTRGTHQGELMGVAATGKAVTVPWMALLRVQNGKITEDRVNFDMLSMLQQLGVIPPPGQGGR